ncbi:MAG: hypothetical protein Q7J25_08025 [Vicinamibacterales bacterium]|nr:hypothetical protein [Vicinamibacterales bacterium]
MKSIIRKYRFESIWLCGLILSAAIYSNAAPKLEAQDVNCFYHFEANWCYDWFAMDCLCDI